MKFIFVVAAALSVQIVAAGPFRVSNYGAVQVKEFEAVVTEEFTRKFPAGEWEIFIHSDNFVLEGRGLAVCNALVGVRPYGADVFPLRRFSTAKVTDAKRGKWGASDGVQLEADCVRSAIRTMTDSDLNTAYKPYPK